MASDTDVMGISGLIINVSRSCCRAGVDGVIDVHCPLSARTQNLSCPLSQSQKRRPCQPGGAHAVEALSTGLLADGARGGGRSRGTLTARSILLSTNSRAFAPGHRGVRPADSAAADHGRSRLARPCFLARESVRRVEYLALWQAARCLSTSGDADAWWRLLQEPRVRQERGWLFEHCIVEPAVEARAVVRRILRVQSRSGPVRDTAGGYIGATQRCCMVCSADTRMPNSRHRLRHDG